MVYIYIYIDIYKEAHNDMMTRPGEGSILRWLPLPKMKMFSGYHFDNDGDIHCGPPPGGEKHRLP